MIIQSENKRMRSVKYNYNKCMETRALITMTTNNIQIIIYYYCLYVVIIYRIMAN